MNRQWNYTGKALLSGRLLDRPGFIEAQSESGSRLANSPSAHTADIGVERTRFFATFVNDGRRDAISGALKAAAVALAVPPFSKMNRRLARQRVLHA